MWFLDANMLISDHLMCQVVQLKSDLWSNEDTPREEQVGGFHLF